MTGFTAYSITCGSLAIHHALDFFAQSEVACNGQALCLRFVFCKARLQLDVNHFVLGRCALPKPSQLRPRSVRMVAERLLG